MPLVKTDDYRQDHFWYKRRLTPEQLLVHDVILQNWQNGSEGVLSIDEVPPSEIVPDEFQRNELRDVLSIPELSQDLIEQNHWTDLVDEFGWLQSLRLGRSQQSSLGDPPSRKCRWVHISSKQPDCLEGCLFGFSNWRENSRNVSLSLRQLGQCISKQERFSKHGQYFNPFFQGLSNHWSNAVEPPLLLSIPFLDWGVQGKTPPLRFQIDKREGYQSNRSSSHLLRSILQHFYRLEDTAEREKDQVFNRYRPWTTDRELDFKIRRWYSNYPTSLNVDELWILVIDDCHIVSFSSNQTWKSKSPPLQYAHRVAEVSFRGIRNALFVTKRADSYTASTHVIPCLSGAVGMLHRSTWPDIVLCLTDRYAGYLNHLQYRLHRAPSTKLLMELLQIQEELNIVIKLTKEQLDLLHKLPDSLTPARKSKNKKQRRNVKSVPSPVSNLSESDGLVTLPEVPSLRATPFGYATLRQLSANTQLDPLAQLIANLEQELLDLQDLRDNSNNLVTRTVQLVNIRLEDHGKAILVFTMVTIIFLPLSFVSSFFGMNVVDIRNMSQNQGLFWIVAASVTVGVVGFSMLLAFYSTSISEKLLFWKERQRDVWNAWRRRRLLRPATPGGSRPLNFKILQSKQEQSLP
ncbi:MAG: hypothetical protein M1821_007346 [Bathelium mastoideum]|nr:MAG: hypothetical protein M1821_007346 [Bathelium mastoideum]